MQAKALTWTGLDRRQIQWSRGSRFLRNRFSIAHRTTGYIVADHRMGSCEHLTVSTLAEAVAWVLVRLELAPDEEQ